MYNIQFKKSLKEVSI